MEAQLDLSPCDGCDCCGLRCEAGVQLSRGEFDAVQEYAASSPNRARIELIVTQDKSVDLGDGVSVTMCRYRDMEAGGCAVYPARPLICRLLGHVEWMPCPIDKVERRASTPDSLQLMRAYSLVERRTFEGWETAGEIP